MNMTDISEIMFFTTNLDENAILYFDDIELSGSSAQCDDDANPQVSG